MVSESVPEKLRKLSWMLTASLFEPPVTLRVLLSVAYRAMVRASLRRLSISFVVLVNVSGTTGFLSALATGGGFAITGSNSWVLGSHQDTTR